jgi:antimicrobial peptide system SdpA family protein
MKPLSLRALGAFGTALAAAWITLAVYAALPAAPYSPLKLPHANALHLWAPQGWAFFTRSPKEQRVFTYVHTPRGWASPSRTPHGRLRNALGFNRASRAEGVETALLLYDLGAVPWGKCRGAPTACLDAIGVRARLRNASPNPTFCGTVGLVLQDPVPWAWVNSPRPVVMPSLVVKAEVSC